MRSKTTKFIWVFRLRIDVSNFYLCNFLMGNVLNNFHFYYKLLFCIKIPQYCSKISRMFIKTSYNLLIKLELLT